jgi:hypothetical protein
MSRDENTKRSISILWIASVVFSLSRSPAFRQAVVALVTAIASAIGGHYVGYTSRDYVEPNSRGRVHPIRDTLDRVFRAEITVEEKPEVEGVEK